MEQKNRVGPFLYVWLAISVLLNVSGIASILDGFVQWGHFSSDGINQYRVNIREPVSAAFYVLWPTHWARIEGWVFDALVVLAGSLMMLVLALPLAMTFRNTTSRWQCCSANAATLKHLALNHRRLLIPYVFLITPTNPLDLVGISMIARRGSGVIVAAARVRRQRFSFSSKRRL